MANNRTIVFENARIIFRNFSGKEGKFNPAGNRNFCLLLEPDIAKEFKASGWNVKYLRPKEEGDEPQAYTQVRVSYAGRPPKITLISSRGETRLDEEDVQLLDWADITTVDLILTPYEWEKGKIKGYLKTMFVTIYEDELELKYANGPDSALSCIGDDCPEN